MRRRLLEALGVAAVLLAVTLLLKLTPAAVAGQAPAARAPAGQAAKTAGAPKTPWGEPDLQGIWTDDFQTPLQRAPRYATKEFFTDEERAELDRQRAGHSPSRPARDARQRTRRRRRVQRRVPVGQAHGQANVAGRGSAGRKNSALDAGGAEAHRRGPGIPARPPAADATCKNQEAACAGGKYGPVSPKSCGAACRSTTRDASIAPTVRKTAAWRSGAWRAVLPDFGRLPPDRAVARRRLDFLRHGPGARMAAHHPRER